MWLQSSSFVSMSFWAIAPVYGYLDWLYEQDRRPAYEEYRLWLQVLQQSDPQRRLTLKAPAHTGALAVLHQTLPDAMLIQTHRDPVTVSNSLNSLISTLHRMASDQLDLPRMVEANLRMLQQDLERNLAAREAYPNVVFDVQYEQLVADPIGTVQRIYHHFGLEWSSVYEAQLKAYMRENPRAKHGQHSYAASDFGQTPEQLAARFGAYSARLGLFGAARSVA